MTAALTPETALELIASYGADPARWPDEVRAPLLVLSAQDAAVAAALAEARALDAELAEWAKAPADGVAIDIAAILALPQENTAAPRRGTAWRPALLAASLALVMAVGGWLGLNSPVPTTNSSQIAAVPPSAGAGSGEGDEAFAYVFTPTAAEEDLI